MTAAHRRAIDLNDFRMNILGMLVYACKTASVNLEARDIDGSYAQSNSTIVLWELNQGLNLASPW